MKKLFIAALGVATSLVASAQVTLYQQERFYGPTFVTNGPVNNLDRSGFNDRASSAIVQGGNWQVCSDSDFRGACIVLRPGQYPSLAAMGMNNSISSLRRVSGPNYAYAPPLPPPAPPPYQYYPHHGERLYQAPVVAVRAVMGPPEQRCWVEQQAVNSGSPNVAGAIIGGVLGGVLGHQIGSGRGNDVATAVGAVGGAAVGANVNRGQQTYTQNVQRCGAVPGSGQVSYWDVTYNWRGTTHRAQLSFAPGSTITVNGSGEPRV